MTKDRITEFKRESGLEEDQDDFEIEFNTNKSGAEKFLKEADQIRFNIEIIKNLIEKVENLHENILVSSSDLQYTLRDELDERMNEVKTNSLKIRQNLKIMSEMINQEQNENPRGSVEIKIKRTQYSILIKEFSDTMNFYYKIQADYRDNCKKRIQRQLEITGREANDEELEEMIESKNPQIFTEGILTETKKAKQALADIEARHKDIMNLEKNIMELHEMFTDFALLIELQGPTVDNIETNMINTVEEVKQGETATKVAVEKAKKVRKKKCIIISIVVAIIVIIALLLIVLLSVYIPKKN